MEHAFGRLKGRFPILSGEIPGYDRDEIWQLICSLMVLHNLLLSFADSVGGMDHWDGSEPVKEYTEEEEEFMEERRAGREA